MPALENLKYLIEALRGGSNPDRAIAAEKSVRSTYNPQGLPMQADSPMPMPLGGKANPGQLPNDPDYIKYLKTTSNPKKYMDWLEAGG